MAETNTGSTPESLLVNVNIDSLYALRELRALQAVTNEPALRLLAEELREEVRASIEEQGISLEDLAREYSKNLKPITELGALVVLMARHEYRAGHDLTTQRRSQASSYLSELDLYLNHIKIFFLHEFADELPAELTAILRTLPMPTLQEIAQLNPTQAEAPEPQKPLQESAGESIQDEDSTRRTEPTPEDNAVAIQPAAGADKSQQRPARKDSPKAPVGRTKKDTPKPESLDPNAHKEISPDVIISFGATLDLLKQVRVTIDGEPVKLMLEDIYLLAMFKTLVGQEVKLADYKKTATMQKITAERQLVSPESTFSNALNRMRAAIYRHSWPISLESNGLRARSVRYKLLDDKDSIKFWVGEDSSEPATLPKQARQAKHTAPKQIDPQKKAGQPASSRKPAGPTVTENAPAAEEGESLTEEEISEYTQNLFEGELMELFKHVEASERGTPISELLYFTSESNVNDFIDRLSKWGSRVNGHYEVDTGEESGSIRISRIS